VSLASPISGALPADEPAAIYRYPDQCGLSLTIQNGAQIHDIVLVPEPPSFPP